MTDISFDACTCGRVVVSSAEAVAALQADNERLRRALEDIADGMGEERLEDIGRYAPLVARRALEGK